MNTKKVSIKLKRYEASVLAKFLQIMHDHKPRNLDMESKLIIACCKMARERVLRSMISTKSEYRFTFTDAEALGILQASVKSPFVKSQIDNTVINEINAVIHQKLV